MPKSKKQTAKKASDAQEEQINQQIDSLTEDLKRVQADFINYKRRSEEERLQSVAFGKAQAISKILSVIDSLERALENADDSKFADGVKGVHKQLLKSLKDLNVTKISDTNVDFDPEIMEAVSTEDSDGEANQVLEVLQPGYVMNEQLIRPAMVKVSK